MIDFASIIIAISALVNIFLAFWVYHKKGRNASAFWFSAFIFSLVAWCISILGTHLIKIPEQTIIWGRFIYGSGLLIATTLFIFSNIFPKKYYKISKKIQIPIFTISGILFIITIFTNYIIKEAQIPLKGEAIANYGNIYPVYFVYIIGLMISALYFLFRTYKKEKGVTKAQSLYVFLGILFTVLIGGTTNIILPTFGYFNLWAVMGPTSTFFMVFFIAYGILKYRLMDIRVVLRSTTVYGLALLVIGICGFLVWQYLPFAPITRAFIMLAQGLALFYFLPQTLMRLANKYLFASLYSKHKSLEDLTKKITTIIDLDKLTKTAAKVISRTIGTDKIAIAIKDSESEMDYRFVRLGGFDKHRMYFVSLLNYCFETQGKSPLVFDEIQNPKIQKQMQYLGVELALPLISKNELQGIIMLGKKYSGEAYSREDLDLLSALTNQTSVAIENSRLYDQVKDLSENLEQKVSEQTKNIKDLLSMKSELLNTISHQLRTPTSIFRGMLSMIGDKKLSKEEKQEFIDKSLAAADRLVVIINSINQANELQGSKVDLQFDAVDLDEVIENAMLLFKRTAKEKQVELKYVKPEKDLPKIMAHADYLKSVIEKLIDNAVWYTNKNGKILITTEQANNKIKIIIKDTGIGLTEDDKKILFKKFSKGRGAKTINMNSSGLGLFIAKKIITAHKGEITAESQGKDQGSTFTITIPVMQEV